MTDKSYPPLLEMGLYRHHKGDNYYVTGLSIDANNRASADGDTWQVIYRDEPSRYLGGMAVQYNRSYQEFTEEVPDPDDFSKVIPRFAKITEGVMTHMDVIFITGNQHKADYLARLLDYPLKHQKVELDELQSLDLHEIVEHKARQAFETVKKPVLVEDVSLEFTALGKLPGPFIKFFIEYSGDEVCCRMLDNFDDRSATIRCTFGYYDGKTLRLFDSTMPGRISDEPKGNNGYGFDRIFIGEGDDITRAEMTPEDNERTYRDQMKPIAAVREFLKNVLYGDD